MDENTPLFITKKQFLTIWPHLEKARMRLLLRPILVDKKLDPYDDPFLEYFAPPSSPQDEKIMILADLAAGLLFNIHEQLEQVKISSLIRKALMEIDQAYEVMKNEGGGWGREANEKNRQSAVLDWFQKHKYRLSYLKEPYLQDIDLYEDHAGQEKRYFCSRLIAKIIRDTMNKKLTIRQTSVHLKNIYKAKNYLNRHLASILKWGNDFNK